MLYNFEVKSIKDLLSVQEAAAELEVSPRWIQRLIKAGRAKAVRIGNQWVLEKKEVERLANEVRRKTGRPPKKKN